MSVNSGYSITGLTILSGGSNFTADSTFNLVANDPGQGSGFAGTCSSDGDGAINSTSITSAGSNYSSGRWSNETIGSSIKTIDSQNNFGATAVSANGSLALGDFTNQRFGVFDSDGNLQVLQYTEIDGDSYGGITGWRKYRGGTSNPHLDDNAEMFNVRRSSTGEPGAFTTIGITDAGNGRGCVIVPTIGFSNNVSVSKINTERGVSSNTANSDIHDLYQAFNTVGRVSKPNFDWFGVGPIYNTNSPHPISFNEFFSSTFDAYGGAGCFSVDTPITMDDRTIKNIEDLNPGEEVLSLSVPSMPLDFDNEDTWKTWIGDTMDGAQFTTALVKEIYFDWYENYYLLNDRLKVTYEHPFFVRQTYETIENGQIVPDYKFKFMTTDELLINDEILTDTSGSFVWEKITSKELIEEELETVNINVESRDVYFAGGVLVHNVHEK